MHKLTCQKQPPSVSYQSNPKVSSLFPLFSSSCVLQLTYGLGGRKPQIMEPQGSTLLSHSVAAASSQPAPSTPTGARVWLSSLFLLVELFIFRYFLPSKGKTKFIILFLRCYRESEKKRLCFYPLKPQLEITSHQAIQFPPLVVTFHLLLIIFRMFHCFAVAA